MPTNDLLSILRTAAADVTDGLTIGGTCGMDAKGGWVNEAAHQQYLARRRRAYRAAHPRRTAAEMLEEAQEIAEERAAKAATAEKRDSRLRLWQFACNSGLKLNWASEGLADLKDFFETGTDRLAMTLGMIKGFKYMFYRVFADGDFLRGYIVLDGEGTTLNVVSAAASHLDFWPAMKKAYVLDSWVADSKLPACGKFYMSGHKPKYL